MKSIIATGIFIFLNLALFSQNEKGKIDDGGRIALTAFVPEQSEGLTHSSRTSLQNKLGQIAMQNGMGASALNNRFYITADVTVLTKDITATAPPMQVYTLDVGLYIGDGIEGRLFSSTSVTLKGVGNTETKAYTAALKNLKTSDPRYQAFINEGKDKIIEYYNTQCDFILKEAEMLSSQNQFEAAIAKLVGIPEVCKECYDEAMEAVEPMYQKQIDRECLMKLNAAQGIWSSGQDRASAESAAAILGTIEPSAACFGEVQGLFKKIETKVHQIDDREWKYVLKDQAQKSEMIEAYRAVGIAYGQNQPEKEVHVFTGWR